MSDRKSFSFDQAGNILNVYELEHGLLQLERIEYGESYALVNGFVIKTDTEHRIMDWEVYAESSVDGYWTSVLKGYGTFDPAVLNTVQSGAVDYTSSDHLESYEIDGVRYGETEDGHYEGSNGTTLSAVERHETYVVNGVTYTEIADDLYVAADGSVLTGTGTSEHYVLDHETYSEQPDGTYVSSDGSTLSSVEVHETYVVDGVTYTETSDGRYVAADGSTLASTGALETYIIGGVTYTETVDGTYVAPDGSVLTSVERHENYVIDGVSYIEQPDGSYTAGDGTRLTGTVSATGILETYVINGVTYTEQSDGLYKAADGSVLTSIDHQGSYVIDGVTYTESPDGSYSASDGTALSGTATSTGATTVSDTGTTTTQQDTSAALDIRILSETNTTVTFGIFADPAHDPGTTGLGSAEFSLSHDPQILTIDSASISFASGVIGVPNYNASTGVLIAAGAASPSFDAFNTPLVSFDVSVQDGSAPVDISVTDIVLDSVSQTSTTETFDLFDLSTNSTLTTAIVDRFGNALTGAETTVSETSWGDQLFVRETGTDITGTNYEIVALPTVALSAMDFELSDNAGLVNFQLSNALSGWTVQANTATPDQVVLGGFAAPDGSFDLAAGQETVVASFTTATDANFTISGIALNGVVQSDISTIDLLAKSNTGNVTTFDVDQGVDLLVAADMALDTASDQAIGAYDALQALRLAVGLTKSDGTATWHDYIAADINKDGRVGADDALNILKTAVGLTDGPAPDWVFVDSNADYSGITRQNTTYDEGISLQNVFSDVSGNLTGILVGDVDGSFIM